MKLMQKIDKKIASVDHKIEIISPLKIDLISQIFLCNFNDIKSVIRVDFDLPNWLKKQRALEWWSKGADENTFKHTAVNEIGHALDDQIQFNKEPEFIKYYQRIRSKGEEYTSRSLSKPFRSNTYVKSNLSEYGSYNEKEFIAEALAEFYSSENPRQIAKDVAEMLRRYWKKRYNKSMNKNQKINLDNEFDEFPEGYTIIIEPYGGGPHLPGDNYDKF